MTSYIHDVQLPAKALDHKPFHPAGERVVSIAEGKEYVVHYVVNHPNEDIKSMYRDFKMAKNKLFWLSENRGHMSKFDINVDHLIRVHSDAA